MRVLLVKMSSLGDVVHTLPAITDAARARPGLVFDWVIEEDYTGIAGWHPSVRRVIPIALRRWRRAPWGMIRRAEWLRFRGELRRETYDLVLDAQGLMKSGWIGWQARGPLAGRGRASAREWLASALYHRRHEVELSLTEVEQLRQLFARAIGYEQPEGPADFGISPAPAGGAGEARPYAVLAHGAAWPAKLWPEENWRALARELAARGLAVRLPWGSPEERRRAERIAGASGGEVLPRLDVPGLAEVLGGARLAVGLDTGLTHMAIALGTPAVTLYGPSVPVYAELAGRRVVHLASTSSKEVDTRRRNTVPFEDVIQAAARLLSEPTAPV